MPSTVPAAALRTLHRLLEQLADLRGRLERGPKQVAAHHASVKQLGQAVLDAHEAVKQTKLAADGKQLDLKGSEEKIQKWQGQLNAASSNTEYKALEEQIAAGEMAGSVLEDEILEMLGRIDDLSVKAGEAEKNLEAGRSELAKVEAHVAETSGVLRSEIARLEADLETTEKELPGDFKENYRRVVAAKGPDALAPCEDGVCEGCGQKTTLNMQSDLALSKPIFCQSCGSLLYLPE